MSPHGVARPLLVVASAMFASCSSIAWADQSLMVADNGVVACEASAKELTRISLINDAFVSVSKVETGDPSADVSIVHEPSRGDIYLSVPDGFSRKAVSFFGITKHGFVYKFLCSVSGEDAKQVFIGNADLERNSSEQAIAASLSQEEQVVRLVQAMDQQAIVDGYEILPRVNAPVNIGDLRVQLISEYRGATLSGKTIRIENRGRKPVEIEDGSIKAGPVQAISIVNPRLDPGAVTTAYIVENAGGVK